MSHSRIPGFHRLSPASRLEELKARFALDDDELAILARGAGLDLRRADKMVENCVGVLGLPIGLGLNFRVNGRDYAVPMAIEEASVIAAVSKSALLVREAGGFEAEADPPRMIGQIQLLDLEDPARAAAAIEAARGAILARANDAHPGLARRGGGAIDLEVRAFDEPRPMIVVHLVIDCIDAMGANAVNSMAEAVAPTLERIASGRALLRILSNLADRRLARARCAIPEAALGEPGREGREVAAGIAAAYALAAVDPYRAATHNKGVMNGVDAVAIATGNDWRGVEAGAHAYAARSGRYRSLTHFWREDGLLCGSIELPMAVGTVGGSTEVHPTVRVMRKILGVRSARELAGVVAAVGLAQNLAALRALATDGIQRGHMRLHARSVALAAGVDAAEADAVAKAMVKDGRVRVDAARALAPARRPS
jgi:hydroxymethylglutaryl-CoA reductase